MLRLFSNFYDRRTVIFPAAFAMVRGKYYPSFQARMDAR
jgi:hypothetical protein